VNLIGQHTDNDGWTVAWLGEKRLADLSSKFLVARLLRPGQIVLCVEVMILDPILRSTVSLPTAASDSVYNYG
jgi:hypothetical protein